MRHDVSHRTIGDRTRSLLGFAALILTSLALSVQAYSQGPADDTTASIQAATAESDQDLPHDWYLNSSPTITADWRATTGNVWTMPFGLGVGKLVNIGQAPVDFSGTFYGNATTPAGMPTWSMSFQVDIAVS